MDPKLIAKLIAGPVRKSRTGGYALVRTDKGTLERVVLNTLTTDEIGGFQGRQGTVRRSRKGASRIQANGRRFYAPYGVTRVVAYKA